MEPALGLRLVVAAGWALAVGTGLSLLWLMVAPPEVGRGSPFTMVALVVLAAASVSPAVSKPVRRAVSAWLAVCATFLWLSLVVAWLIVFPGARWAGIVVLIVLAGVVGLVAVLTFALLRVRRKTLDGISALTVFTAGSIGLVAGGGGLRAAGVELRFEHVRDRYEEAIRRGAVEQSGGFVDGDLAGWVWADKLVLDPLSGVIFDPADRLDSEQRFIGALGEIADCERITINWFHCIYS